MARILVVYATTDGHTARVATAAADGIRSLGIDVDVIKAGEASCDPADYSGTVVAASLHAGGYQRAVRQWVREHATTLATQPTAFLSVCLGVLEHDPHVDAQLTTMANRFFAKTGWRPAMVEVVAGALPYTRYNWLKRLVMKRIAAKAGGDTDTSRDYEYTDWVRLQAFASEFGRRAVAGRAGAYSTAKQVA
jgi:menaquinone-dependent protoporphyrinogen oxidase